jgi:hypothetical protein
VAHEIGVEIFFGVRIFYGAVLGGGARGPERSSDGHDVDGKIFSTRAADQSGHAARARLGKTRATGAAIFHVSAYVGTFAF